MEPTSGFEPETCSLRAMRGDFPPLCMSVQSRMRGNGLRQRRIPPTSDYGRPHASPLLHGCCQIAVGRSARDGSDPIKDARWVRWEVTRQALGDENQGRRQGARRWCHQDPLKGAPKIPLGGLPWE